MNGLEQLNLGRMAPNELPLGFLRGFKQGFFQANLMESREAREEPEERAAGPGRGESVALLF